MSAFYRVDNRLIHGQIIATWMPYLRLQHFLLASETVPDSALQMSMFRMAIPSELGFDALPIREAARWLAGHRNAGPRTMVLFETVADAIALFAAGNPFAQLNIGNVHHAEDRRRFTNAVYLSEREIDLIGQLTRRGVSVEIRSLPTDAPIDLKGEVA